MRLARIIALATGLSLVAGMAFSMTDPVFAARRAAEDLKSATRALTDAREAQDRVKALSRTILAYENGLQAMRAALREVAIRETSLKMEFKARRGQLARLLGALQTIGRVSTPLLLIHPAGPLATVRSAEIMSAITPALQQKAARLRRQLQQLVVLRGLQTSALGDLTKGLEGVQQARIALAEALGQRTNLPKRFTANAKNLKLLAQNSKTLTQFADGLADLPFNTSRIPAPLGFAAAKGKLPLPVSGTLLRGFNEAGATGVRRPGIVLSAPAASLVTTPFAATIRYLGPLLDYGNVIILEPGAGYLIVLAGLGQVYGQVGQILSAGDPVGLLRGADPSAKDFLVEASQGSGEIRQETLYVEIRKDRVPVDPSAWFALNDK